jgi:hypothetical protein
MVASGYETFKNQINKPKKVLPTCSKNLQHVEMLRYEVEALAHI